MKAQSKRIVERLATRQASASVLRWLAVALCVLVVSLRVHELAPTLEMGPGAFASESWWHFVGEALLVLLIMATVLVSFRNDQVRTTLEQALNDELELFREMAGHVGEVFWLKDAGTGELLYVSPAYERVWGRSPTVLYKDKKQWLESIVPGHRAAVEACWRRHAAGGYDVIYEIERPDRTRRWIHDRAFPITSDSGEVARIVGFASDITERQRLSEQLKQRDRLLSMATQMARLGGWSADLETDRVALSDEACAIFDVPPGTVFGVDEALEYYTPEFRPQVIKAVESATRDGEAVEYEAQVITALGRSVWVRVQGHLVINDRQDVVKIEGAIQDITERKHTSSLLSQGLQRFRDFSNAMPHLVWTAEPSGRLDFGNLLLEQYLGCVSDDPDLDTVWRGAVSEEDSLRYNLGWERALEQGQRLDLEIRLRHHDGELRWHALQATPIRDVKGRIVKWYGSAIDVHERRESEEHAKRLVERLATTLESITDAFFTLDSGWVFTYVNREAERLLHRSREELLGQSLWDAFPEAKGTVFEAHYRKAVQTGEKASFEAYYEPLCFWASVNAYPSSDGLAVYFQDVTERRRAEKERERIRELEASRELAEMANATKSQFLASMSHEIRTPINGIVGMIDALHQSGLQEQQMEMVNIVRESAESLLSIVDDILDFSKIEAGKLELSPVPFSPSSLVRSVCLLLDRMALNLGVELTMYADPRLPAQVLGDELRVRQVLLNLVNNAIKFSSKLDRPGRVAVRLYRMSGDTSEVALAFHVIDNGIGMTLETQNKLFKPFSQADASTTRQYGGTGLGLSISSSLVDLMKGDIKVSSERHRGTEFRVTLRFSVVDETVSVRRAPSFQGVDCVVWPEFQGADWAEYLRAAGARVYAPSDVPASAGRDAKLWLLVRDIGPEPEDFSCSPEAAASLAVWPGRYHWLLVGRGHRRMAREKAPGIYEVDSNSLSQLAFLHAVSVALGQERPQADEGARESGTRSLSAPSKAQARAQGRLVLVAEDNETNQRVIERQLGMLGYAVDLCQDGEQALRRWRQSGQDYALLLIDLHMPGVDGYSLVSAIRREESDWESRRSPIVALTANVAPGEADRCRQLGFDDYLVKPVVLNTLEETLSRWGQSPVPTDAYRKRAGTKQENWSTEALNLSVLQELIGGDESVLAEFVDSFDTSSEALVRQLLAAAERGDWGGVADAAHTLKSSARTVGANGLADCALALEEWGRKGEPDLSLVDDLMSDFEGEWRRVRESLAQFQQSVPGGGN